MAASQFGVLTPLQHYNQPQQQPSPSSQPPQQQQQQQLQQQQQQRYYNQSSFQSPPAPPPPPPPPSQQKQQQQQHVTTTTTTSTVQPTINHTSNSNSTSNNNSNIHPQPLSKPPSPTLNGTAATTSNSVSVSAATTGSQQTQSVTNAPDPAMDPASTQEASSVNPPATDTAAASSPTYNTALPNPRRRRRTKRRRLEEEAELSLSLPVPPRPPTVHQFSKGPYDTLEDAIFSLQLHVFTSGYGVSQKRTVKEKLPSGKYDPDGDVIRKDFACDKGGNEFVSQSRGERRRESKKCGCRWKAAIRRLRREGDRWFIEILEAHHNHPVTPPDEMHTLASYRRWQRENNAGIRSAIARLTRAAAMPTHDIAAYLKGDIRDHDLDRIDKQILRALSMNDKDVPSNEREGGSIVFEMIARRPVIILQDNDRTSASATMSSGYACASNPLAPANHLPNPSAPTAPFNEPTAAYHHTFTNTFTNPPPTPMGGPGNNGTAAMHSEYAVPQQYSAARENSDL
ncbi:hypothetical protein GGR51DRAFT_75214 [Nemania sp. FL0031]|nr:hypothetical protein GGR51DRAFT_75214 [Nemania sp. FL0031]